MKQWECSDSDKTQKESQLLNEYEIYLKCADNGSGGDITRDGKPLITFDEWIAQ